MEQGLTAEKLAYESELGSKGFLSDIEHGLALPSLTTLERIAQRLDVSLFDLLVVPGRSDRERLVDLTRGMPKGPLARLLRELSEAKPATYQTSAARLRPIRAYTTLEVAAGWSVRRVPHGEPSAQPLRLPGKFNPKRDFAVRASGTSMQGFRSAIHDGDWLVMRKVPVELGAVVGEIVLVLRSDKYGDESLHLKRVVQSGRGLMLHSDDSAIAPIGAAETDRCLATLVSVIPPETLAPAPGTHFAKRQFPSVFGLEQEPSSGWSRIDGHLFFVLERAELRARGGLVVQGCVPRPAETAFVLKNRGDAFEYVGVARFDESDATWRLSAPSRAKT